MKKVSLFIAALLGLAIMYSCEDEITSTQLTVDESKTATFKLYVRADLDTTAGMENAPDGTEFILSVPKNELNASFTGNDNWTTTAATSNGVLETELPATNDGVNVSVDAITFEHTYVVNDSTSELRKYEYTNTFGGIKTGTNNVFLVNMTPTVIETIIE